LPFDLKDTDYMVWRRFLEVTGDRAMLARLDALHAAEQAKCKMTLTLPDGTETRVPVVILCEAAVAAQEGQDEAEWRQDWTRRLVQLAVRWQDELTTGGVVNVLNSTDFIVRHMVQSGVWPWGKKVGDQPVIVAELADEDEEAAEADEN